MLALGIDVGFEMTKVILLNGATVISRAVVPGGYQKVSIIVERALNEALENASIILDDIECIASTGFGKNDAVEAQYKLGEFACLAKAAEWVDPAVRTLIDVGAQKSLAVRCISGKALNFAGNERCAVGSGRMLEMVASILGLGIEEIGKLSLRATQRVEVLSTCAVFMETEVISLVHSKTRREDILKGVFYALASRLYALLLKVRLEEKVMIAGGVARNVGLIEELRNQTGCEIFVPENPGMMGALGAALIAQDRKENPR